MLGRERRERIDGKSEKERLFEREMERERFVMIKTISSLSLHVVS